MRALKWLAAAFMCAAAVWAVYRLSWLPYQCEVAQKRTEAAVIAITGMVATPRVVEVARNSMDRMQRCIEICPADVGLYMALAANQQVMGLLPAAANTYITALRYDRRPEIYLNLGRVQLQLNAQDEAVRNLTKACLFNINYINEISDSDIRNAVLNAVHLEQSRGIAAAHPIRPSATSTR